VATKDIRLQSGFVIFAARISSVLTGLIFQFIVAHALVAREYDIWFNINDINMYFVLLSGVLPFWAMRYVTRDKEGSVKTGVFANLIIAAVAAAVYIIIVPSVMSALQISLVYLPIYLLMAIQIFEIHSISIMESCLQARMPQKVGYGLLVQQITKVILGLVLIIGFKQLLLGAIVATLIGYAIQTFYYFKTFAVELKKRLCIGYIGEWLKGSLANIYSVIGNQIAAYIFIMLFAYVDAARGIYGAAATIVNVITYSSFLSFALYPKLLAEKKTDDIASSMKMVLMFAVPLTVGAIALADSYITLLRPEAAGAGPVLMVLAVDSFVIVISGFYSSVLYGFETVDEGAKLSLRELVKSRLFISFSLPYLHSAIALPTAYYVLQTYAQKDPIHAALYVSIVNAVVRFLMFLILLVVIRGMVKIHVPWRSISKYVIAAAIMGAILYLLPHPTTAGSTLFEALVTLVETGVGGAIYLGVLMAIDKEARSLPRDIINEFRPKPTSQ
jgi:hypothetical protein